MITTQQLMDYTNYEFTPESDTTWEWTEDGSDIGVRIEVESVQGENLLKVISHDTGGYVLLTERQVPTHIRTAIDVMQFAEDWDQEEWSLEELVAINAAVDQTLSFFSYVTGFALTFGWGMNVIEKTDYGFQIYTDSGFSYACGTIAGLAKLFPRLEREQARMQLGWTNWRVAEMAKSVK